MTTQASYGIGIVGGGIIGLCSAYYLRQAGYRVTVFDRNTLTTGCSFGNGGLVMPGHIVPLAQQHGVVRGMGLHRLLGSASPFYIRPRLSADLLRWSWLFYRHATPEHLQRAVPALRDISLLSKKLYRQLTAIDRSVGPQLRLPHPISGPQLQFGWQEKGLLMLYQTAAAERSMAKQAKIASQAGLDAWVLSASQVQDLERDVRVNVRGAVYYPGDAHLNPGQLMRALVTYLEKDGVQFVHNQLITDVTTRGRRIESLQTAQADYPVDELILANGAWSAGLARRLGFSLPLQGGKGYSFMVEKAANLIHMPALMVETRTSTTPMADGLRFAGTLEVTGTNESVNRHRVWDVATSIRQYYPDMPIQVPTAGDVWTGLSPCSPDGLPYIGRVRQFDNLTVATGHGTTGLSLGPATGKLVAEIIDNQPLSMDPAPFRPDRFSPPLLTKLLGWCPLANRTRG